MKQKSIYLVFFMGLLTIERGFLSCAQAMLNPDQEKPVERVTHLKIVENPSQFPWCINGEIISTFGDLTEGRGSGTLISEDCVLTAAYNICWQKEPKRMIFPKKLKFRLRRNEGEIMEESQVVKARAVHAIVHSQWVNLKSAEEARAFNLGIIKLEKPLGKEFGYAKIMSSFNRQENLGKKVTLIGYPIIPNHFNHMCMSEGIIQKVEDVRLYYDNATFVGMGGAAIMAEGLEGYHCVGIHTHGNNQLNNGIAITEDYAELIQQWIQLMKKPAENRSKLGQSVKSKEEESLDLEIQKIKQNLRRLKQKKIELTEKKSSEVQQVKKRRESVIASPPSKKLYHPRITTLSLQEETAIKKHIDRKIDGLSLSMDDYIDYVEKVSGKYGENGISFAVYAARFLSDAVTTDDIDEISDYAERLRDIHKTKFNEIITEMKNNANALQQ